MTFFCIADKDSAPGFKLVGIETLEVVTRQEALEALRVARATKDAGIILVTEKAAALVPEEVKVSIKDSPIPLIIEIPSRGQTRKHGSAAELLKELAGVGA
ncbi:MAG: V-type ATP synthase subunit F [Candidatus Omnitrophica bacterium]|nr:V-type ATP synthase subunit F [Candidatus Omnitrophota bacterium]